MGGHRASEIPTSSSRGSVTPRDLVSKSMIGSGSVSLGSSRAKNPRDSVMEFEEERVGEGHRKEEDFLFGSISAAKYQEFTVIKINKRGKRQQRILGIDGFNTYNIRKPKGEGGMPASLAQGGGLSALGA
jgi:hypothetical protein